MKQNYYGYYRIKNLLDIRPLLTDESPFYDDGIYYSNIMFIST
jgi:hypothetical protein